MTSHIVRQAIYDTQHNIVGYELLYRRGNSDCFPVSDFDFATSVLIDQLFDYIENDNQFQPFTSFINFDHQSLINGLALKCPTEHLVVEVLESALPNNELFSALLNLKAKGYRIAFDDFIPNNHWLPFLHLADIIKLDFRTLSLNKIQHFVGEYHPRYPFQLLAEKIETEQELYFAKEAGFSLFQGYQLSKPEKLTSTQIGSTLPDPDFIFPASFSSDLAFK